MKSFIPQDKEDLDFALNLENANLEEVRPFFKSLLEWTMDINWPQVSFISDFCIKYYSEIEDELIIVLNGTDSQWKYSILNCIISHSVSNISVKMEQKLNSMIKDLSYEDKEEGLGEIIYEILKERGGVSFKD